MVALYVRTARIGGDRGFDVCDRVCRFYGRLEASPAFLGPRPGDCDVIGSKGSSAEAIGNLTRTSALLPVSVSNIGITPIRAAAIAVVPRGILAFPHAGREGPTQ